VCAGRNISKDERYYPGTLGGQVYNTQESSSVAHAKLGFHYNL